jgi:eukaryotic-like serine/threonine-protein kinase
MDIQDTIAHYRINAKLGEGGMGAVYRATDTKLNREVAIKVLPAALASDAQYMARFEREAQVLASLNHPNIAAIYGIEQGAIVMELVEGSELKGPLPLDAAIEYARQIATGLEAAHEKGVVHRDLKPANVKVTPEGVVKLLDFGLAKATEASAAQGVSATMSPTLSLTMTQAGMILGTAAYMAPEQARGHMVDRRADVWAFGAVLFELLSGKPAFPGDTVTDILASVVKLEPDWASLPATVPPPIRRLVKRCLVKERQKRLQAIGEARLAIEEYQADPTAGVEAAPSVIAPPARKPRLWMAVSGALLMALATVLLVHVRETPPPDRVLRYTIPVPDKSRVHSFAISPDGRYLAISAAVEGKRQIWLRSMETMALRELRGSEDATLPFWSPDSRSVAFSVPGKLKRAGIEGGPAVVVCDAPGQFRGGAWATDGTILFSSGQGNDALKKVPAAGGVAAPVGRVAVRQTYPVLLPDGTHYLYSVMMSAVQAPGSGGVYLAGPDGNAPQRLVAVESSALWVPPLSSGPNGHLVYQHDGVLMAQPMDAKTVQPDGGPFPIAEQVSVLSARPQASISQTGLLVYWNGAASASQLTWYDRSGKDLGTAAPPAIELGLALSPDEKTVAVSRAKSGDVASDIWFHELARGVENRFTLDAASARTPIWSPDGRRMIYSAFRGANANLYLRDTSGSGKDAVLLPPVAGPRFATDWSRDGHVVAWEEGGNAYDLWTMNLDGDRKPVPFANSEFNETQGKFSPDGRWLAYASDESGRYEVYVRPFPTGAGKWRVSLNGGELPYWRGDGKEIFYLAPDRKIWAAPVKAVPGTQPSFTPEAPQSLSDMRMGPHAAGTNNYPFAVSGDGKRFLVLSASGENAEAPLMVVVNWLAAVKR